MMNLLWLVLGVGLTAAADVSQRADVQDPLPQPGSAVGRPDLVTPAPPGDTVVAQVGKVLVPHRPRVEAPAAERMPVASEDAASRRLGPGERAVVAALAHLAAWDSEAVDLGVREALESRLPLFDAPLGRLFARGKSAALRARMIEALGGLAWPASVTELQVRIEVLAKACFDADPAVRLAALKALGRYPVPEARRALRDRLRGATAAERAAIQAALAALKAPAALATLASWLADADEEEGGPGLPADWSAALAAQALLADPSSRACEEAIADLAAAGEPALVRPLIGHAALHTQSTAVRAAALAQMRATPLPEDEPVLLELLAYPGPGLRLQALEALAGRRSPAAARAAAKVLRSEEDPQLLKVAATVLREQETAVMCQALLPVLGGPPGYGRVLAVFILRERQGREVIWPKVLAQAVAPSEEGLAALAVEDPEARREELLPRLAAAELSEAERIAILEALAGVPGEVVVRAVAAQLGPTTSPAIIRAAAPLLLAQPPELVLPRLRALLATTTAGPAQRATNDRPPATTTAGPAQRATHDGPPAATGPAQRVARDDVPATAGPAQRAAYYELLAGMAGPEAEALLAAAVRGEADPELGSELIRICGARRTPDLVAAVVARLRPSEPPRIVAAALAALAQVQDPTLAPTLLEMVRAWGPDPSRAEVTIAAYDRLLALGGAAATSGVQALAVDERVGRGTRLRAIRDLGELGAREDVPLLEAMLNEDDGAVRGAARRCLHRLAPDLYPEWDRYGRYPLVLASAGFGATLLVLSLGIVEESAREPPPVGGVLMGATGAALGAVPAWLFTMNRDLSLGQAGYFATLGTWGTLGGLSLSKLAGLSAKSDAAPLWAAIGGEVVGVSLGALTSGVARFSVADVALTNAAAGSWGLGGVSLAHLLRLGGGEAGPEDVFVAGGLVATSLMAVMSPRLQLDANAVAGLSATIGLASWVGAFAPLALLPASQRRDGDWLAGVGVGQAVGLAGGLALSQLTTFDTSTALWAALGALSGAGAGAGLGLSQRLGSQPTYALLEGGTLLAGGLLGWLGPKAELSGTDVGLVLLMAGGGAATGARMPERAADRVSVPGVKESSSAERRFGGALLGGSVGLWAGLAASQLVELSVGELTLTGVGAGVLGTGAAGLTLLVPELGGGSFSQLFATGAAIGVVGLGAYLAPRLRYEPADATLGLSTLALGGFLGSLVPAYRTPEGRPLRDSEQAGGAMLGGALGLVFAGAVSQWTEVDPRRVLRVDGGAIGGMAIGAGIGLVTPESLTPGFDRRLTVGLVHAGALLGYGLASATKRKLEYDFEDRVHQGLGLGLGAWHGSLVPYLWREPGDPVPRDERLGGALLGAAAGVGVVRLSLGLEPPDGDDVFEIGLASGLGISLGSGLRTLARVERRGRYGLFAGAGLAPWLASELLATRTSFDQEGAWLVGWMLAAGAGTGAGLPYLTLDRSPTRGELRAGAAAGVGALGLFSMGLAQVVDYDMLDTVEAVYTSGVAAAGMWGVARARQGFGERRRLQLAELGALSGLGAGLVLSHFTDTSGEDAAWIASGAALGGFLGALTPQALHGRGASRDNLGGGLLAGAALGSLAMTALFQAADLPPAWALAADGVGVATSLVAGGLALMEVPRGKRHQARSMQLAAVGGFVAAGLVSPWATIDERDAGTISITAALGAFHGTFVPEALGLVNRRGGGALAGTGAGMLLGYGIGRVVPLESAGNVEVAVSTLVGDAIGSGLALMLGRDGRGVAQGFELGGLAALGLGVSLQGLTEYRGEDAGLIALGSAWGAWHGGWLGRALAKEGASERQVGGGMLLGLGAGALTCAALSQLTSIPGGDMGEATMLGLAGDLLGGGLGLLLELDPLPSAGLFVAGGIAGIASGLLLGERTTHSGRDVFLTTVTTGLGAAHGAMLHGILAGDDQDLAESAVGGGAMLGAGVGLAGGMLLSQAFEVEAANVTELLLATAAGDAVGFSLGQWLRLERRPHLLLVEAGGLGLATVGLFTAPSTAYGRSDRLLIGVGSLYGAWLGGWAPLLWEDTRSSQARYDPAAGMLLGLGAGALVSAGASQLVDYDMGDVGELALGSTLASVMGAGLGLVLQERGSLWVGLMEGMGIAGTLAVAAAAPHTTYSGGDAVVGALAAGYGLYQGAGMSLLVDASDRQVAGAMMAVGAAGALAGSYLGRYIHLTGSDVLMLLAGSAWGMWIGV